MGIHEDIELKEKGLTDLMARVLKEPLRPLGESVISLSNESDEIKENVIEIVGSISSVADDLEDLKKELKNTKKICDGVKLSGSDIYDKVIGLGASLAEYKEQLSNVEYLINESPQKTNEIINEHLHSSLSLLKNGTQKIFEVNNLIIVKLEKIDDALTANNNQTASYLKQIEIQLNRLENSQDEFKRSLNHLDSNLKHEIKSLSENEKTILDLTEKNRILNQSHDSLLNKIDGHIVEINFAYNRNIAILIKIMILTVIIVVTLFGYIGYDIFNNVK